LPTPLQRRCSPRRPSFVIDATKVARDSGMGGRINTIMQVCFFALSGVLPKEEAIEAIKDSIKKTYGKKGEEIVQMNLKAVDNTLEHLHEVPVPNKVNGTGADSCRPSPLTRPLCAEVLGKIVAGFGDDCRSARSRATAHSRPPPRNTRSATWRWKFRCGTRPFASSA
jgi:pyruvate-ferredoxin/flavodoxin oxidoreductase